MDASSGCCGGCVVFFVLIFLMICFIAACCLLAFVPVEINYDLPTGMVRQLLAI